MTPFLNFKPIYQERVWGGRHLESYLGRKLPGNAPIGESWDIVDRPEAQSVVATGQWAGQSLREVMAGNVADVMGPTWPKDRPFPILVKWLDCRDRLSVQVHPPASIAAKLGGEPKTENWYFAAVEPGAAVYAGLRAGVGRREFEAAIAAGSVEQTLERPAVRRGDSLLIHSGVMHAIDAGNVILEIQQNSDTTYRVYDWGRVGLDGKPRALHVRESLECLSANNAPSPRLVQAGAASAVLAQCREFTIRQVRLQPGDRLEFAPRQQPRILSVVEGSDEKSGLRMGDNVLVPFSRGLGLTASAALTLLVTENFNRVA